MFIIIDICIYSHKNLNENIQIKESLANYVTTCNASENSSSAISINESPRTSIGLENKITYILNT